MIDVDSCMAWLAEDGPMTDQDLFKVEYSSTLDMLVGSNHDPQLRAFANKCYLAGRRDMNWMLVNALDELHDCSCRTGPDDARTIKARAEADRLLKLLGRAAAAAGEEGTT